MPELSTATSSGAESNDFVAVPGVGAPLLPGIPATIVNFPVEAETSSITLLNASAMNKLPLLSRAMPVGFPIWSPLARTPLTGEPIAPTTPATIVSSPVDLLSSSITWLFVSAIKRFPVESTATASGKYRPD